MRKSLSAALALVAVLAASGLFAQRLHAEGGLMRGPPSPSRPSLRRRLRTTAGPKPGRRARTRPARPP